MIHHVLLAIGGETPQVITETLYGLWRDLQIRPDGVSSRGTIHILTTVQGRQSLMNRSSFDLQKKIEEFNQHYEVLWKFRDGNSLSSSIEVLLKDNGIELKDLFNETDHQAAFNKIKERVIEYTTQAEVNLHASIAGGRRSLGVVLAQLMTLYARSMDTLSHVIANRDFTSGFPERKNGVVDSGDDRKIHFVRFPFPRLNLSEDKKIRSETYSQAVQRATALRRIQSEDPELRHDMRINLVTPQKFQKARLEFTVTGQVIHTMELEPVHAGLYLFLFKYANKTREGQGEVTQQHPHTRIICNKNPAKYFQLIGANTGDGSLDAYPWLKECITQVREENPPLGLDVPSWWTDTSMGWRKDTLTPPLSKLGSLFKAWFKGAEESWLGPKKGPCTYGVNIPPAMFQLDGKSPPGDATSEETGLPYRNVLLLVGGETPAILWESLLGLKGKGVKEGEIHVLTTGGCLSIFREASSLLTDFNDLHKVNWQWSKKGIEAIRESPSSQNSIQDLLTVKENNQAADRIFEAVQFWMEERKKDRTLRLHASVAGGRKTMGVYLAQAMSWLSNAADTLSHVVVARGIEGKGPNYMVQPLDTPQVYFSYLEIFRSQLPEFVRARPRANYGYKDIADLTDRFFRDISGDSVSYELDLTTRQLRYEGVSQPIVQFGSRPTVSLALYYLLCKHANAEEDAIDISQNGKWREQLNAILAELGVSSAGTLMERLGNGPWENEDTKAVAKEFSDLVNNTFVSLPENQQKNQENSGLHCRVKKEGTSYWVEMPGLTIIEKQKGL